MSDWTTAITIGLICGAIIGSGIVRFSLREKPVYGGVPAHFVHYLACSVLSSTTPYIVTGLILGVPFILLFSTGISFFLIGAGLTVAFGYLEARPLAAHDASVPESA